MFQFKRPVGAKSDCKEIEFIATIHQANVKPRKDGSITAYDVSHFLLSRYGIKVTEEEVRKTIIKGFGGGDAEEECIDLAELTATLFIPFLVKESRRFVLGHSDGDEAEERNVSRRIEDESHVFGKVLKMILGDVTGSLTPTTIDHDLIRKILVTYGEPDLAGDNELVHSMFVAATGGRRDVALDEKSFAKAIAGDIQHYDADGESTPTSNFYDVFPPSEEHEDHVAPSPPQDRESPSSALERNRPEEVPTATGIDYVSDTHRSKMFTVLLWTFLIMTQYTYIPDPLERDFANNRCGEDYWCIVKEQIIQWIYVTLYYSIGGTIMITIGSMGNSFGTRSIWPAIGSILFILAATITPVVFIATNGIDEDWSEEYAASVTLALGLAVVIFQVIYLLGRSASDKRIIQNIIKKRGIRTIFSFLQMGNIITESHAKKAAVHKTSLIISNAASVHSPIDQIDFAREKSYSLALLNYGKYQDSPEACGGFFWTWHHLFFWRLAQKEGILIPSKLLTANILQLIMSVFLGVFLLLASNELSNTVANESDVSNLSDAIRTSGRAGAIVGFVACLGITLNYLPAIVKTTMQLRCGKITSLDHDNFSKYMKAPDSVSKVPGSMFWAVFFAGGATYVIITAIVFFFTFENTRRFALSVLAQIIGFLIPTILKILVLLWLRSRFYAGHYRSKPVLANLIGLALQCLDYGLAYGYMWFRTAKLVIVSVYYIGRVDTPLFDESVASIGDFDIDDAPVHFRKLIIAHEAHRHPYIELLGKMYLLKLRYREEFGRTSGSRWRMIFVSALMPWMRRHRVMIDNASDEPNSTKNSAVVVVDDLALEESAVTEVETVGL